MDLHVFLLHNENEITENTCMHFNSILHELQLTHIVRTNGYLCSVLANFGRTNSCHVVVTKTIGLTKTSSGNSYCNCAHNDSAKVSPAQKHKHKMLTTNYKRKGKITVKVGKIGKLWYSAWAWKTAGLAMCRLEKCILFCFLTKIWTRWRRQLTRQLCTIFWSCEQCP